MHSIASRRMICILVVFAALVLTLPPQVFAATITTGNGCSLKNAIKSANRNTSVGGCTAGSGADTIVMSYNIKLRRMLPDIKTNITITGGDYFISGKNQRRIFTVKHNGNLTINNLTMRNGNADNGGAIRINDGRVIINNSTVRHNTANVNGGAIWVRGGSLTIQNSTVRNNSAETNGGAIRTDDGAVLTIQNSTLKNNEAGNNGGAIWVRNSTYSSENNTMQNNSAGNNNNDVHEISNS